MNEETPKFTARIRNKAKAFTDNHPTATSVVKTTATFAAFTGAYVAFCYAASYGAVKGSLAAMPDLTENTDVIDVIEVPDMAE